jgi:hypothetical protein
MSTLWEKFSEFWAAWGPWISVSLIPTIIVGLSVDPRTHAARNAVEKAWNVIKQILDVLSVAKPKDRPGTFQLPLKLGAIVEKKKDGTVLVLIFALSSYGAMGCAWMQSTGEQAKKVAIDCSVAAVQDNARALVPALIGMLTGGAVNWKDQVKVFAKEFGRDATACALTAALQRLNEPVAAEPVVNQVEENAEGAKRAAEYIDAEGWEYK